MDVVWLKRDVRFHDHVPLATAAASGRKFVILYMYEPDQLAHESMHGSHVAFINEGLEDFERQLQKRAGERNCRRFITTVHAEATQVLSALHAVQPLNRLLSHQETGHGSSFSRDRRVAVWCRRHNVTWQQIPQSAVVRGLRHDGSWHATWVSKLEAFLQEDVLEDPFTGSDERVCTMLSQRLLHFDLQSMVLAAEPGSLTACHGHKRDGFGQRFPSASMLGVLASQAHDRPERQKGGESVALALLADFLHRRGEAYSGSISSPNSAWTACSRLSPYLSWGHISLRTVWQNVEGCRQEARGVRWGRSLKAFLTRLQWRSSYCQRFEMRCWMEHQNVCPAWEHLREGRTYMFGDRSLLGSLTEEDRLRAFMEGCTGYPMVDACMRCLLKTGWLNFRMRCMLVSFAVYNLWLDWRCIAGHLARCFLDYEPGIHYPQLQMQAGTTGCDLRCYSVTRQAKDQDPEGNFIRKHIPELQELPGKMALEPWKVPSNSELKHVVQQYPQRIVDEVKTSNASKTVVAAYQQWFLSEEGREGRQPPQLETLIGQKDGKRRKQSVHSTGAPHKGACTEGNPAESNSSADGFLLGKKCNSRLLESLQQGSMRPALMHAGPWSCPRCTLINIAVSVCCEACNGLRPAESDSLPEIYDQTGISEDAPQWTLKQKAESQTVIDLD